MNASIDTLKNQLAQLKQLHESGALPAAEYESSKAALERRVLDLVLAGSDAAPRRRQLRRHARGATAGGAALRTSAAAGTTSQREKRFEKRCQRQRERQRCAHQG